MTRPQIEMIWYVGYAAAATVSKLRENLSATGIVFFAAAAAINRQISLAAVAVRVCV